MFDWKNTTITAKITASFSLIAYLHRKSTSDFTPQQHFAHKIHFMSTMRPAQPTKEKLR